MSQHVLDIEMDAGQIFIRAQKKVKIEQLPKENVDFALSLTDQLSSVEFLRLCHCTFKNYCNCRTPARRTDTAYLKMDLAFENYLHEMSHDYKYKITCSITDRLSRLQEICSFDEVRTTKSMNFLIDTNHCLQCILDDLNEAVLRVVIERFHINPSPTNRLQSDFQALLENPVHSDVTLILEADNTTIKAHKSVLSCRSPVFRGMFNCDMKESQTGIVKISDVSTKAMLELLRYIYTGRLEDKSMEKMTDELFEAAVRYQIDGLKSECIEYYIFNVTLENVHEFSKLVDAYEVKELKERISAFMKKYKRIVRNN